MGRYEAEITDMKVSTLIALADYFNVTTDYVLGRTDKLFQINYIKKTSKMIIF